MINDKKRILVIDDEPDLTLICSMALDLFSVDSFNDPLLALSNFKAGAYDLVVLDIIMPKVNGFELYQKIRRVDNKVKICFLTGLIDLNDYEGFGEFAEHAGRTLDKDLFIHKPIQNEEFI